MLRGVEAPRLDEVSLVDRLGETDAVAVAHTENSESGPIKFARNPATRNIVFTFESSAKGVPGNPSF